jgi:leucyl aminopeptidase
MSRRFELLFYLVQDGVQQQIGIVGKGTMSAAFYEHLMKGLPTFTFIDAADLVDSIKAIKSDIADVKNVGDRWAGAITAAKFLQEFVEALGPSGAAHHA